ncbi:MAG: hypothetical protein AAB615_00205 [Patescibacteria group bacterium]
MQRLLKIHALVTALFVIGYFLFTLFDPGLLSYTLREKFHVFADDTITLTATVLAPPVQPVVTATAVCDTSTGQLRVELDWANDVNSSSFDIDRDSLPLVTGLTASAYNDTGVLVGTSYSYEVTANGPMGPGFAISDPVSVTTPSVCDVVIPDGSVTITTFNRKSLDSYSGTPSTTNRRPFFAGTSNIANADIEISVGPDSILFATLSANANGYFEWRPTNNLPFATQTFSVTATDPTDSARTATDQLEFRIREASEVTEDTDLGSSENDTPVSTGSGREDKGAPQPPATFQLTIGNKDGQVYQGQELYALLYIESIEEKYQSVGIPLRLSIIDLDGNVVTSITREEFLKRGGEVRSTLSIPPYIRSGEYLFQAEAIFEKTIVSVSERITILELPIFQLGGGTVITYNDIIRNLSWIVLLLVLFFLFTFLLLVREFGLFLQGKGTVAEGALKKAGYFDA